MCMLDTEDVAGEQDEIQFLASWGLQSGGEDV